MSENKIEIERRFILRRASVITPDEWLVITQWYKKTDEGVIRYRKTLDFTTKELIFEKIIKSKISKGVNNEQHFEINRAIFESEVDEIKLPVVQKTRRVYNVNGFKFEVDEFHHINLVICEVELPSLETEIEWPSYLQNLIITEITGMDSFSNKKLARPFNDL